MRLIDAEKLEKAGWKLIKDEKIKELSTVETVRRTCEMLRAGDVVFNLNNNSYGVVISINPDKDYAQIIEVGASGLFINCPPLRALEKSGRPLALKKLILEAGHDG